MIWLCMLHISNAVENTLNYLDKIFLKSFPDVIKSSVNQSITGKLLAAKFKQKMTVLNIILKKITSSIVSTFEVEAIICIW